MDLCAQARQNACIHSHSKQTSHFPAFALDDSNAVVVDGDDDSDDERETEK